jgi:hypothetical protein
MCAVLARYWAAAGATAARRLFADIFTRAHAAAVHKQAAKEPLSLACRRR